ncbi:MAG: SRPBCC family protein [Balneolaceae bacterium]|jgi:hypothetical protein
MKSDKELAAGGQIRSSASITASAEMVIHAGISQIWELITDFNCWPMWMEDVSKVSFKGNLSPGNTFRWKTNGLKITSELQLVEPETRLAWTGKALGTRAIHVWEFKTLDNQTTLVSTRESMEGLFIRIFYSSEKLEETLMNGLRDLKLAAYE